MDERQRKLTPKHLALYATLLLTPLLVGGGIFVNSSKAERDYRAAAEPDAAWLELNRKIRGQVAHFPGVAGVVVKDMTLGWTIEHNSGTLFPSASLIKIPVMAALYDAQPRGEVSLDEVLTLKRGMRAPGSGTLKFERAGTPLTVRQLIYRMITESDNTATNMLTGLIGMNAYNSAFLRLGLTHTNFSRMIMDLRKRNRGIENWTTAGDMARILELIYRGQITGSEEMLATLKDQKVNDRIPAGMPQNWPIGHKTGLMRDACHDVGIVFAPTGDYVLCILTTGTHNMRRAKAFISEVAHLTALYYSDPSVHYVRDDKKPFWKRFAGRRRIRAFSEMVLPGFMNAGPNGRS